MDFERTLLPGRDFYIDPHRAVDTALITHAHSDHARRGSRHYVCVDSSVELLKVRLGRSISVQGVPYGKPLRFGEVQVSFHSAGHVLGSAQIRIEHRGEVWVASGDYKREPDPSCEPFDVVACDVFITEATFGTPSFTWPAPDMPAGEAIHQWWKKNEREGYNSLLFGYSLGKAQRILAELADYAHRPIWIHPSIQSINECYLREGIRLASCRSLQELEESRELQGELILAPPAIERSKWSGALGRYRTAFASGWMAGRSGFHLRDYDEGFVMSDHADWKALNRTIDETGARTVYVQHRGHGALVQHLRQRGLEAYPIEELASPSHHRQSMQLRLF